MKKKRLHISALVVVLAMLLSACGSGGGSTAGVKGNEILVGEVDPLTGPAAVYGAAQSKALKMAVDEINEAGGVTVGGKNYTFKLISYDDKGDANEAISASRKLIDRDGVKYILGWAVSGSTSGASKVLGQEDVLMLIGNAGETGIVTQGYKNIFRTRPPGGYTGGPAGGFVAEQGVKKLAVLGQLKDSIYKEYTENFKEKFMEGGGEVVAEESFSLSDRDMYTQLTKIIGQKPDAIFVPGSVEPAAFVFKQLRELNFQGEIYSFTGGTPEQFSTVLDIKQMEGIYDLRPLETTYEAMSEVGRKYVENFRAKYNETPVPSAVNAYDQMYVLKKAIETADSLEVPKLIEVIKEMSPPEEAALSYITVNDKMFDENGQAFTTNVAMQWKDGEWQLVKELEAAAEEYSAYLSELRQSQGK
ncbi:ABC transporter substrate-binding protein [Paenibacillus chungangensis]|uniref:ABC transporter substrate-binding protein n=1 Tax=Paenibacillus chungangensis TaxID=696535 RepID=A0ABW3HQX6_9BACL